MVVQNGDSEQAASAISSGNIGATARLTTELTDTSQELKHCLKLNSTLLEHYSHELLHVQSLAAQLVQMNNMQQL